jgi:cytochrome c
VTLQEIEAGLRREPELNKLSPTLHGSPCARCHAIGPVGESPLAKAPPFRTLHLRYPVSDLQRPLLEGIHSDMPRFQLTPNQVTDVMAYFKTLEQK